MAIVTYISRGNETLTEEEKKELKELREQRDEDIVIDEESSEITDEQWKFYAYLMKKYKTNIVTKEMVMTELRSKKKVANV